MSEPSLGNYEQNIQVLQSTAAGAGRQTNLWNDVAGSLDAIAGQLRIWGQLHAYTDPPAWPIVKDASSAVDQLAIALLDFDRWLKQCKEAHWKELKQGLIEAQKCWTPAEHARFSSYKQWRQQQQLIVSEPETRAKARIASGRAIIIFAGEIKEAVEAARKKAPR